MSKTILPNHSATAKSCKQCVVLSLYLLKKIMTDLKKNKKTNKLWNNGCCLIIKMSLYSNPEGETNVSFTS